MAVSEKHVVTGAFGFTGRSIARRLLSDGKQVLTLTNHPSRDDEFGGKVDVAPFEFDQPDALTASLRGADVLYNTYWVRFPHGGLTYDAAVENTMALIRAAVDAGVRKMVHVSIANPSDDSPYPYYRGKAALERAIKESGLQYTILRPTVIFGKQGILINNIAWFLRHMPVFAIPGSGQYRLQPVFAEDLADMAVREGAAQTRSTLDAVGPETYTFEELLRLIARTVGSHTILIKTPAGLALKLSQVFGLLVGDVVMTRDEVGGLMDDLLVSSAPPTCTTLLSEWMTENAGWLGKTYMSELRKHY